MENNNFEQNNIESNQKSVESTHDDSEFSEKIPKSAQEELEPIQDSIESQRYNMEFNEEFLNPDHENIELSQNKVESHQDNMELSQNNIVSEQCSNKSTGYDNFNEPQRKKKRKFSKVLSYVIVGVLCTGIGGASSAAAVLYLLPNSSILSNTPLYTSLMNNAKASAGAEAATVYDGHPTQLASTSGALSVTDIAKKVGPAVVAITSTLQASQNFFGNQGASQSVGSGIIISSSGYILTNYHVVDGAQQVKITLSSGKIVNGKVINYDQNYDVAVVKITDNVQVPAIAQLGDSDTLQVGESVVAIGNPLGTDFFGSVTTGVVSALNRKIQGDANNLSYIQTDAAINSGNSGGPLINSQGQVIGINTAKIDQTGVEGLGFAIPINAIKNKIPDLSKPALTIGIQGVELDSNTSSQYNLPKGIYVQDVTQSSPAAIAGIQAGDVIIKFDGQRVSTFNDLTKLKNKHKFGDQVSITVYRNGSEKTLSMKFQEAQ